MSDEQAAAPKTPSDNQDGENYVSPETNTTTTTNTKNARAQIV